MPIGAPATIRTSYLRQVRAALCRVSYGCVNVFPALGELPHHDRHRWVPSSRRLAGTATWSESWRRGRGLEPAHDAKPLACFQDRCLTIEATPPSKFLGMIWCEPRGSNPELDSHGVW